MILGDVEDDGNVRAQGGERLQLKGGDFDEGGSILREIPHGRTQGKPDVPAGEAPPPRRPKDGLEHGDGGRLAVGPRHGDGRTAQGERPQLHLPHHALFLTAEEERERMIDGDARA